MSEKNQSAENLSTNHRSRSIFRQFADSFGAFNRSRNNENLTNSIDLINSKPPSIDSLDPKSLDRKSLESKTTGSKKSARSTTPNSFAHRVSLLHQVKSHLNKNRKNNSNQNSTRSAVPFDLEKTERKCSEEFLENFQSSSDNFFQSSIDPFVEEKEKTDRQQSTETFVDENQSLPSISMNTNRIKSQLNSTNPNLIKKSPSLTSLMTNISSSPNPSNDLVYWIEIHLDRGKDLSIKDLNGTSDPYVKVFHGGSEKYTSSIVHKNLNPIWNEKFTFFVHDLSVPVIFHLFDYDRIGRDEPMGTVKLDLNKLPIEKFYAATLDLENEKRTDGKTGMIKLSVIIMPKSCEFRDEVLRLMNKQFNTKSSLPIRPGANNAPILGRRTIDIFIIEGRNFSSLSKNPNLFIRLKFGTHKKYRTQTAKSTTNPKWHQSFMYDIFVNEIPPLELTVIDDTASSNEFVARGVCNLMHLDEERTHRISVDLEESSAVIDLFVTITGTTPAQEATNDGETSMNMPLDFMPSKLSDEDYEHFSFLNGLRTLLPINDVGKVEIKIYQARDLSAKDINGKSDPFCVVELDSTRLRTQTIYKTLDPVWNKSFVIPVQDIHSVLELTIFDEDVNKSPEFIGKLAIPLLAISNGERRWMTLKDRKCILPVKGIIEIEATLIFTNVKAILRTFNPRQVRYYQADGKIRVAVFKQHINRVRNMIMGLVNLVKFIDQCFQWERPLISFFSFMLSLIIVWNFQIYMLPFALLLLFVRGAVIEYRRGRLGSSFSTLGDETVSAVIQPTSIDEDLLDTDGNSKEQKKSLMGVIHGIQDTVLEIQGYVDDFASTLERIKNLFNFTVPWLSVLAIVILSFVSIVLYYIPLRYLVMAFVINKFTKCFRKPKGYIDNNELADFVSRLPSDPELLQYREIRSVSRLPSPKKTKRLTSNGK